MNVRQFRRERKTIKTSREEFSLGQQEGHLQPGDQREDNWKYTWAGRGRGLRKLERQQRTWSPILHPK